MRSSWKTLVVAAAAVLAAPVLASADDADVQEQIRTMQERMSQLEDRLQATDEELSEANRKVEQQQSLIEESGIERAGQSALSSFISQTVFDGFVAASYTYNFNDPSDSRVATTGYGYAAPENSGLFQNVAPYHGHANNFQVDQVWFGMEKAATAESRGGFRADIVFGATADGLNGFYGNFSSFGFESDGNANLPHLYQAYAQYLAPLTEEGISIKAGRYETLIGYESFKMNQNNQITRGILWGIQPINHTGVLVEGACSDCGVDWALGIANNFGNANADTDNSKTGIGRVRWTGETSSLAIAGLYGGDVDQNYLQVSGPFDTSIVGTGFGRDADAIPMLDVIATWDPSENLSTWINYTHVFNPINGNVNDGFGNSPDISVWGIAAGGRLALNDVTGVSTRFEYVNLNSVLQNEFWDNDVDRLSGDADMYSVTATLDRALTDHLTLKLEGRWDKQEVEGGPDDIFVGSCDFGNPSCGDGFLGESDDGFEHDDQFLALIYLMYEF